MARILRQVEVPTRLIAPLGSNTGVSGRVIEACRQLEVEVIATAVSGHTRTCVIVVDPETGVSTVINETGPRLDESEAADFVENCRSHLIPGTFAIGSGSLPPGVSTLLYRQLSVEAEQKGCRLVVDSSGGALRESLKGRPWAIKVNQQEIAGVTGERDPIRAAEVARRQGVGHVVVTRGAEGALYVGLEGAFRVKAPNLRIVNPVGSGDVFTAILVAYLRRGETWQKAIRYATAGGSLASGNFEPRVNSLREVEDLAGRLEVERLET